MRTRSATNRSFSLAGLAELDTTEVLALKAITNKNKGGTARKLRVE